MPPLRRIQFSPLSSFRTALRIGVMATAATFSGDTDLDATESKSIPGLGLNLVHVQPGSFNSGAPLAPDGRTRENAAKTGAANSKPFWLGATAITVGQWRQFAEATKYQTAAELNGIPSAWSDSSPHFEIRQDLTWQNHSHPQQDNYPVVGINSNDAEKFCAWLTERERLAGRLPTSYVYGLPTKAQWKDAATARGAIPDADLGFRVALIPAK